MLLLIIRLDAKIGRQKGGMTEINFPTRRRFHQDEALLIRRTPRASTQHGPARRSVGSPVAGQRHGDPGNIALHLGYCVSRTILNADASALVLLPALAFVGLDWVRMRLLDHTCVRRVEGIYLVQIVFLNSC